ncbi:MAG TPA: hypothetical protein DEA44_05705, partial [Firmicutes bacterium]|nr:hypothetical protein [Bacillota bacterium]
MSYEFYDTMNSEIPEASDWQQPEATEMMQFGCWPWRGGGSCWPWRGGGGCWPWRGGGGGCWP